MDLGQDTEQARSQRDLDSTIQATGKTMRMVPECGLAPGLVNILGAWLLQQGGDSLQIRVGGLPMNTSKGGDLHYAVSWSPDGVIKEYTDETIAIKDGKLVRFEGLTSVADHEDPSNMAYGVRPLSIKDDALVRRFQSQQMQEFLAQNNETGVWEIVKLEARPTSDGISLMPFDSPFDKLRSLEYKTIRYHAHFDVVQGLIQGGHIEELKDLLRSAGSATPDLVLMRVWTEESGLPKAMVEGIVCGDLALDFATDDRKLNSEPDPIFSAMQHLTGWPTALVADALLSYKDTSGQARPSLFRQDHPLWSGRTLNSALHSGGVIMPYELVDGGQMLTALDRDYLIPHRQLSWSRAVPSSV
jgi:hypothetical protein